MLLHDAFDFHARARGDTPFAKFEGRSLTYAEARAASLRLAAGLSRAGIGKGDRVCLLQRNAPEIILLLFAASRIGAVVVPLNYRLSPREWIDLTADAEAVALIADMDFARQFEAALQGCPLPLDLIKFAAEPLNGWRHVEELTHIDGVVADDALAAPEDIIVQMYTSGTTGRAKGALLSQHGLTENIAKLTYAAPYRLNPGENTLVVLPLFHIAAIATALGAVSQGGCLIIHREVDPAAIIRTMREEDIVTISLVPAVIQLLLDAVSDPQGMDFPKLRYVGYGASPIAEPVLRRAIALFGCDMGQGYGMTEICGAVTFLTEVDHRRALAGEPELLLSAGKPLPGTEVRIVTADGHPAPVGEVGEILIRGAELFKGYWKQPEASETALAGGWLHSGDAGYLDEEGFLFIRDRVKDMIVSGAENIYPVEIESVLFDHPAVADASVIGIPDDRWGETVLAVVVLRAGIEASADDLDRHCRDRLGGFKVPRRYEFVEKLPRNATGKVLKRELRQPFWEGRERAVG